MLEKLETANDYSSQMDLIHTGSTNRTLVGDYFAEGDSEKATGKQFEEVSLDNDQHLIAGIEDREAEQKRIRRTIDFRMMPLFCIFYFVDYLDRANIGNAT
jgi:hypothetical protein